MRKLNLLPVTFALFIAACSSPPKQADAPAAAPALPTTLAEAVANPARDAKNRERDAHRHPLETLQFFEVSPEMTVVEITPGMGWYTEILAPLLATNGKYIAALAPSQNNAYMQEMNGKFKTWFNTLPTEVTSKATLAEFDLTTKEPFIPAATADRVLTFRNIHNWTAKGTHKAAFAAFFKILKPGGKLGVVEHRADPKKKSDPKGKSGYVREEDVIRYATQAGFKLEEKSEINANSKDTKDHPEGVWTLPPTLKLGDKDREKYVAIGESDRMTLRFVKPMKK